MVGEVRLAVGDRRALVAGEGHDPAGAEERGEVEPTQAGPRAVAAPRAVVRGTDAFGTGLTPVVTGAGAFTFRTVPGWGAWPAGVFTAPHGIAFVVDGGLIVQDDSQHGRVTRLEPVAAGAD